MHPTFEQILYEAMGQAYPGLTVRSMSKLLGKSPGYWSSMTSQKLPLPTEMLIYLSDVVECHKMLLPMGSGRLSKLEKVQTLLCAEIGTRFVLIRSYLAETNSDNEHWQVQHYQQRTEICEPLPFLIGRYS
jgi:hypothetical protein